MCACAQFVNDKASVHRAILDIRNHNNESVEMLFVQWFAVGV